MRTISITSGKGGVGKTSIAVNLGIALANRGKRVLLFDADLGLANVDVLLGTRAPYTLQHVLAGEKRVTEIVARGPGGLDFIAGGSGIQALVNLSGPQLDRFLTELSELERETDILIFDTGAGIDDTVMAFLEAADETLLVATPDPASITDAYATAKTLFARKPAANIRMVLNMVANVQQGEIVYGRVNTICRQFLDKTLHYLGAVRSDPDVVACTRKRQPFILAAPKSAASTDVGKLADRILGQFEQKDRRSLVERLRSVFGIALKKSA
ncbi:MAG: MinD/ParA family protein [Armatimonadetes bacterium]|nr:MinD/ParA family protein [Armatimonadota bacterium]